MTDNKFEYCSIKNTERFYQSPSSKASKLREDNEATEVLKELAKTKMFRVLVFAIFVEFDEKTAN